MKPKLIFCVTLVLSSHCHAAIVFPRQAEEYRDVACRETIAFYRGLPSLPEYLKGSKLDIILGHRYYYPVYRSGSFDRLLSISITSSSGWEYMLMCGTNMVGVVGLRSDGSNHWSFGGATFRGQPDPIWVGLERAKELPQVKDKDYEFRFLSPIGADYPIIWLHGDGDDILIPLSDGYGKWKAYRPYSESEMINFMRPILENMLEVGGILKNTNAIPGSK
jgi:hypothetical protein